MSVGGLYKESTSCSQMQSSNAPASTQNPIYLRSASTMVYSRFTNFPTSPTSTRSPSPLRPYQPRASTCLANGLHSGLPRPGSCSYGSTLPNHTFSNSRPIWTLLPRCPTPQTRLGSSVAPTMDRSRSGTYRPASTSQPSPSTPPL